MKKQMLPSIEEERMAFKDLLTTDYGLMSLAVIVIMIGIAVFLYRKLTKLMAEEPQNKG